MSTHRRVGAVISFLLAACGASSGGRPADAPPPPAVAAPRVGEGSEPSAPPASESNACPHRNIAFNLAKGGTVTASHPSTVPADDAKMAFDDNIGTKWSENASPTPWIAYEFSGTHTHVVTTYTVTSARDRPGDTDPKSWEFQGSNDPKDAPSITWTTLDKRSDQSFASRQLTLSYAIPNTTAYHRYRLLVTANGGGAGLQLGEIQLFGPGNPVLSVDDMVRGTGVNQFQYSAHWDHTPGDTETVPLKYGLSSSWSRTANESATITFVGSQVILYAVRHTQHGIIGVSIDGGKETEIDLFGPLQSNALVYTSPLFCTPGTHTLKIRITGNKNPESSNVYGSIDRIMIIP